MLHVKLSVCDRERPSLLSALNSFMVWSAEGFLKEENSSNFRNNFKVLKYQWSVSQVDFFNGKREMHLLLRLSTENHHKNPWLLLLSLWRLEENGTTETLESAVPVSVTSVKSQRPLSKSFTRMYLCTYIPIFGRFSRIFWLDQDTFW